MTWWLILGEASASASDAAGPRIAGIPVEFFLFVAVLLGVAVFKHATLQVALAGLTAISAFKLFYGFDMAHHLGDEWVTVANLFGLLLGFMLLADHFDDSGIPKKLPKWLPNDWRGGLALLGLVFVMSSFLDNIAAAMIGGTVARTVFKDRVHMGYLAALVAASNAGGSGSVLGDTTTTMMWIHGVLPRHVFHAYVGAIPAVLVCGVIGSLQQDRYQRISKDELGDEPIDWGRIGVVIALLLSTAGANLAVNVLFASHAEDAPWIALALWTAIAATSPFRRPSWHLMPEAARGAVFLLSLVLCASMMPVSELPAPTWQTTAGLGVVSSVFDNIPLTALALAQGGYDWGFLAFAVGFGGSMMWFGSSAGVALANEFPDAKDTLGYLRGGWHVILAYAVSIAVMLAVVGWNPHPHPTNAADAAAEQGEP